MKDTISINLFATLSKYSPENSQEYPVGPGMTISEIIAELDLPADLVKLIFLNGVKCDAHVELKKGDRLGIFPPVGGG